MKYKEKNFSRGDIAQAQTGGAVLKIYAIVDDGDNTGFLYGTWNRVLWIAVRS